VIPWRPRAGHRHLKRWRGEGAAASSLRDEPQSGSSARLRLALLGCLPRALAMSNCSTPSRGSGKLLPYARPPVPKPDPEQYEEVFRLGGAPIHDQPNRLSHLCYRNPTGIRVIDIWRDKESFAAFGAVLGPAVTAAGLDTPPEIFPVHCFMAVDGIRNP